GQADADSTADFRLVSAHQLRRRRFLSPPHPANEVGKPWVLAHGSCPERSGCPPPRLYPAARPPVKKWSGRRRQPSPAAGYGPGGTSLGQRLFDPAGGDQFLRQIADLGFLGSRHDPAQDGLLETSKLIQGLACQKSFLFTFGGFQFRQDFFNVL